MMMTRNGSYSKMMAPPPPPAATKPRRAPLLSTSSTDGCSALRDSTDSINVIGGEKSSKKKWDRRLSSGIRRTISKLRLKKPSCSSSYSAFDSSAEIIDNSYTEVPTPTLVTQRKATPRMGTSALRYVPPPPSSAAMPPPSYHLQQQPAATSRGGGDSAAKSKRRQPNSSSNLNSSSKRRATIMTTGDYNKGNNSDDSFSTSTSTATNASTKYHLKF